MRCCQSIVSNLRNIVGILVCAQVAPAFAVSYGTFDARSLAMGGATVAAGNPAHAHFYNPALLSFENEDEDESTNGRFIFPGAVALVSDSGEAAVDIVSDDLDESITNTVNVFNNCVFDITSPACQTGTSADNARTVQSAAGEVLTSLNDFDQAIESLNQQLIELEAYVGLSVSEPAEREGGSFYFGVRGLVFGRADVSPEDLALIDEYITATASLADGSATLASLESTRVVNGGRLVDPRPSLTSSAQVASLAIGEWGIAFSKEFSVWGQPIAFGATPKILQVEVYRENVNFVDDIPSYSENRKSHLTMNFDLGIAAELFENYRVGFSVRDVLPKTFDSENGLEVELNPRARLGLAYVNDYVTIGLDIDTIKNEPIAEEPETQEAALGIEFSPWDAIDLRFGYRQDFAGEREDILSAGIRYQIWRFVTEASIAASDDVTGGALQFGWAF
ncbi:conjugal transfer protein TraF [Agarilytica rhodophyticola]|uniref:conjugal transfer protein TraF n=1 Tax=Agarilytica rhodophyticola TaxID=1737490 RepID=UPI000B349B30|nr:conjugal transfer protein TraF [Agarilytica rhodophyticola]